MKQTAPSADRNMDIVRDRLLNIVPETARDILEVSSGTGQHGAHCAHAMPHLRWWPTEYDPERLASIAAYAADTPSGNLMPPQQLDVVDGRWEDTAKPERADVIVNINMIHITPWDACAGLLRGAGRKLSAGGLLIFYGPFRRRDVVTADSNEAFEVWLKSQDPAYGLRFVEDVAEEASRHQLSLSETLPVPANNLMVVFRKHRNASSM
ncbi:MAG: DUF938 domain-containing protein [Anderseniella sp.]